MATPTDSPFNKSPTTNPGIHIIDSDHGKSCRIQYCPKCRGVCNCSCFMEKEGHQPTGILVRASKATGCSSVLELLKCKESVGAGTENGVLESPLTSEKGSVAGETSSGKEKSHDEQTTDPVVKMLNFWAIKESNNKPSKKSKNENGSVDGLECSGNVASEPETDFTNKGVLLDSKKREGSVVLGCSSAEDEEPDLSEKMVELSSSPGEESPCDPEMGLLTDGSQDKPLEKVRKRRKHNTVCLSEPEREDVVLPQGTPFRMVAGVEFLEKDVGPALQFLEFCNAFSKVLDLKKGQAEVLLRELANGRTGRRRISPIVQFHIKLLAIIQKDIGEKPLSISMKTEKSWLQALANCTWLSECALKELPLGCLSEAPLPYDDWDASTKLKLLNLLCDETLSTVKLREWIDKEQTKFVESRREVNEKIIAAKKREKDVKRNLMDDMAKAMASTPPLTIAELDNLMSKSKTEKENAQAEMIESINLLARKIQKPSALRTEPVLLEGSGHAYWKLRGCCSSSNILLQDIGKWDLIASSDKWFIYNEEEEKMIENVLSPLRHDQLKQRNILKGKALDVGKRDEKQDCTEN